MRASQSTSLRRHGPDPLVVGFLVAAFTGALVVGRLVSTPTSIRVAVLGSAICIVLGAASLSPRGLVILLASWLTALGLLRRLVSLSAGQTGTDPLLLIGPFALVTLVVFAASAGAFTRLTTLAKAVLLLSVLSILGALNPLQGGVRAGIAGLLFVLVPMFAFWVGRGLVDDRLLTTVLKLVGALAIPAALYGLWQTFNGFPSWDVRWVESTSFAALNIDRTVRPFSSFSSPAEFGYYLALGIIVWLMFATSAIRRPIAFAVSVLLGSALLYEASRTVVVFLVAAVGIAFAARRGVRPVVALAVGATFVVALSLIAGHFAKAGAASSASALVAHDTQGLANPFGSNSTASSHITLVLDGIRTAFRHPIGSGAGAVTIAGSKFGGLNQNTEADPSNVAVALGLPGLVTYLVVLFSGLGLLYRTAARRRDALSAAALAVVIATTLEWLNGGQYSIAFLPWLILGWADARRLDEEAATP